MNVINFVNRKNIRGPKIVPCGTPEVTLTKLEASPSTMTRWNLSVSHELIQASVFPWIP